MITPSASSRSPSETLEPALDPDELRAYVAPLARAVLAHALALGVAADLLLRDGFAGLGFPAWLALLALSALSLVWRDGRRLPREAGAWLVTALLFGAAMAWRDAGFLLFLDLLATLFALGMAAIALGDARATLLAARMRDTVWAAVAMLRSIAAGIIPLLRSGVAPLVAREELRGRFHPVLRATLIALPLLIVFGALLRGADPVFASIVVFPDLDVELLVSHVVVTAFFAWVVAGWARGALMAELGRHRPPEQLPFSLGMLDVTTALGALNALFALYVATQLASFFGGEQFLQARTGLTAAEYARQGFFQMVWVVVLVVPVLVGTRAALKPGRDLERRHTTLALPLIALLGLMIVSAVMRLRLYVHHYGLTTDRLYALAFMGWLVMVLVSLAVTVLRGTGRAFAAGAVITGLATLAALNLFVPDVIVARVNLARSRSVATGPAPALDVAYLAQLGAEAVPLALPAVLAPPRGAEGSAERLESDTARCRAARRLSARWRWQDGQAVQPGSAEPQWRAWNRGTAAAARLVAVNAGALRAVQHASCPRRESPTVNSRAR